jgi:hypothetical protein
LREREREERAAAWKDRQGEGRNVIARAKRRENQILRIICVSYKERTVDA